MIGEYICILLKKKQILYKEQVLDMLMKTIMSLEGIG